MIKFIYLFLTKQIYKEYDVFKNDLDNVLHWSNSEKIHPISIIENRDGNYCLMFYRWRKYKYKDNNPYV